MAAAVDMVTLAEYKTQAELTGTGSDLLIPPLITAASRALNNRMSRELTPKTSDATRTFQVPVRSVGRKTIVDFRRYDLRAATTVTLHPESGSPHVLVANNDYALWPIGPDPITSTYLGVVLSSFLSPALSSFALQFGYAQLQVRGTWGAWDTGDVHEEVKRACVVTVAAWLDRAVEQYAYDAGEGEPRVIRPDKFSSWAVPKAALSLLQDAGLKRGTTV
jgi:hypothetical protein